MTRKVLLVQGGMGAEKEVSLSTGRAFENALKELHLDYEVLDAREDLPEKLNQKKDFVVLNALHGKYAEDGTVQAICEYLKIPYTGSGILASALSMDKIKAKQILSYEEILTPSFQIINTKKSPVSKNEVKLNLPFVVKPSREGSSIGISICQKEEDIQNALELASRHDEQILIEEYIKGKEITVPILEERALTPIEIVPHEKFYDYEHKYTKGKTDYLLPPNLSKDLIKKVQSVAEKAFFHLNMRSYGRIDFIVDEKENIYFIEANTLPGCTETSLLPKSAAYDGVSFADLVEKILKDARLDYEDIR